VAPLFHHFCPPHHFSADANRRRQLEGVAHPGPPEDFLFFQVQLLLLQPPVRVDRWEPPGEEPVSQNPQVEEEPRQQDQVAEPLVQFAPVFGEIQGELMAQLKGMLIIK
jgi:hypothetical protein